MTALQTVETAPRRSDPFAAPDAEPEDSLQEFARVHFEFATWHPLIAFDGIDVAVRTDGRFTARCRVVAKSPQLGTIECGATGCDGRDAIQHVASLLELEVNRRIAARERPPTNRVRRTAGWRRVLPPEALPAAPSPAPALWSMR